MIPFTWKPTYTYFAGGIVLLLMLFFAVNRLTTWYNNYQHSKVVEQFTIDRQKDIKRGDDAEARIPVLQEQVNRQQIALELAGKDGKIAMEKVNEAQKKFQTETDSINAELDNCAQYNKLRASLKLAPVACQ